MSTAAAASQHLTHGTPLAARYDLPGSRSLKFSPPSRIKALLVGFPGEGKSSILWSCPDAFVFNFDLTSTPSHSAKAHIYPCAPGKDELMPPMEWETCEPVIAKLKALAIENKPRPKLVGFDSLSTWVPMMKSYIVKHAKRFALVSAGDPDPTDFGQLFAKSAYGKLAELMASIINDLHLSGYGVYVTAHLIQTKVPMGDEPMAYKTDLAMYDSLWKQLFPVWEMVGAVVRIKSTQKVKKIRQVKVRDTVKNEEILVDEPVNKYYLDTNGFEQITKCRARLPGRVELPERGSWGVFEAAYVAAQLATSQESQ